MSTRRGCSATHPATPRYAVAKFCLLQRCGAGTGAARSRRISAAGARDVSASKCTILLIFYDSIGHVKGFVAVFEAFHLRNTGLLFITSIVMQILSKPTVKECVKI
jgi:hypothetical protein